MDWSKRLVGKMPLDCLWNDNGLVEADKGSQLGEEDIRSLLQLGPVTFVVVDAGRPLRWISVKECFDFWKTDVQPHLHHPKRPYLKDYPNEYFYSACEWRLRDGGIVVTLDKYH